MIKQFNNNESFKEKSPEDHGGDIESINSIEKTSGGTEILPPLSNKYQDKLRKILEQIPKEEKDNEFIYHGTIIGTEEICYLKEVLEKYSDVIDRPEANKEEIYQNFDEKEYHRVSSVRRWKHLRDILSRGDYPGDNTPDNGFISDNIEPYFSNEYFDALFDLINQRPDGVFAVPTGAIQAEIILKGMITGLKFELEKQGWDGIKVPYFTAPHSTLLTRHESPRTTYDELVTATEPTIINIFNKREDPNIVTISVFDECRNTGGSQKRVEELIRKTYSELQNKGQIPQPCELQINSVHAVYPGLSEAYRFLKKDERSLDRRRVSIKDGSVEFRRERLAIELTKIFGFFTGRLYGNIVANLEDENIKNNVGGYKYKYRLGSKYYHAIKKGLKKKS
ncbi:MAG: hypothetical protein ACOCU8_01745 [Patescibacteria group bacterium]